MAMPYIRERSRRQIRIKLTRAKPAILINDPVVAVFVTSTDAILKGARRGERLRTYLFVRECSARWACKMDDLEAFEADFAAPFFEVRGRIIECVAEFDQHV